MKNNSILLSVFVLIALVQLYVPAKMIKDHENVLKNGIEMKFRTAPVDPSDPFRGKYITLRYSDNTIKLNEEEEWVRGEEVFVYFENDDEGFAKIKLVSKVESEEGKNYLKTKVSSFSQNRLSVDFPFDRFYMEETKASEAEKLYNESQIIRANESHLNQSADKRLPTYALVNILKGRVVLHNVIIGGVPVLELID